MLSISPFVNVMGVVEIAGNDEKRPAYSLKLDHSPFTFLALVLCVACSKNE